MKYMCLKLFLNIFKLLAWPGYLNRKYESEVKKASGPTETQDKREKSKSFGFILIFPFLITLISFLISKVTKITLHVTTKLPEEIVKIMLPIELLKIISTVTADISYFSVIISLYFLVSLALGMLIFYLDQKLNKKIDDKLLIADKAKEIKEKYEDKLEKLESKKQQIEQEKKQLNEEYDRLKQQAKKELREEIKEEMQQEFVELAKEKNSKEENDDNLYGLA